MALVPIGYYICEFIAAPQLLHGISETILSVSGCIGVQHPDLSGCFWVKPAAAQEAYRNTLRLDMEQFAALRKDTAALFQAHLLDTDSRFLRPAEARRFLQKYFRAIDCHLLYVSAEAPHAALLREILQQEHQPISACNTYTEAVPPDCATKLLGCDILGRDMGGFHSFLCNSLHSELPAARFHSNGLLANSYAETAAFAERIQGLGEPVTWIPCEIRECIPAVC